MTNKFKILTVFAIIAILFFAFLPVFNQEKNTKSIIQDKKQSLADYGEITFSPFYPTSITIGDYTIKFDSLLTLTLPELDSVTATFNFVSTANIYYSVEFYNKICEKYLPKKLLVTEDKKNEKR